MSSRIFGNRWNTGADVSDAILALCPLVIGVETFAEGPHVHHEDLALHARRVLSGQDGLLGGVHATHRATVIVLAVTGANALQEGNALWLLVIGRPGDVPPGWSRG